MTRRFGWFLDLVFVVLWTCFVVTLVSQGATGWLRAAAVVPFVTLFPGYTLLATLFPSGGTHRTYPFDRNESGLENPMPTKSGLDGAERLAFSVLLSIVVVAMVALLANFTPWGVTVDPILFGVAGWTLLWTLGRSSDGSGSMRRSDTCPGRWGSSPRFASPGAPPRPGERVPVDDVRRRVRPLDSGVRDEPRLRRRESTAGDAGGRLHRVLRRDRERLR